MCAKSFRLLTESNIVSERSADKEKEEKKEAISCRANEISA